MILWWLSSLVMYSMGTSIHLLQLPLCDTGLCPASLARD